MPRRERSRERPHLLGRGVAGLGLLRRYTDSVYPGMILHAVFNAIALLAAAAAAD